MTCCRSLVRNGKATFNPETYAATKEHWWKGSEKLLEAEGCINREQPLFGVTPSVLSRRISTLVLERLEQLHGMPPSARIPCCPSPYCLDNPIAASVSYFPQSYQLRLPNNEGHPIC